MDQIWKAAERGAEGGLPAPEARLAGRTARGAGRGSVTEGLARLGAAAASTILQGQGRASLLCLWTQTSRSCLWASLPSRAT